jgi:hypothetical protein
MLERAALTGKRSDLIVDRHAVEDFGEENVESLEIRRHEAAVNVKRQTSKRSLSFDVYRVRLVCH